MKVSLVQCRVHPQKALNLQTARRAFDQAHQAGADLLVFPETFMHAVQGLDNEARDRIAEPLDGPFVETMRQWAKEAHLWTIFGFFERPKVPDPAHRVYNAVAVISHEGALVDTYRKTHLYDAFGARESDIFLAGDVLPHPIEAPFGRFGVEVCYELRFPEISRHLALQGIDVLIVPAAWYQGPFKEHHWATLMQARALENTVYAVGANQAGAPFTGGSLAVDPLGVVLAQAAEDEAFLTVDLPPDRIRTVREKLPCILQTRPELFHQKRPATS
ncbi:MAG: carbon-nitrogen hydrolase family protein [Firmicutes bacterium]|nr:carbon-nitrogen hydrolase family protein [Bacillota bacterium]